MDKKRVSQIKEQFDLVIHSDESSHIEFWYAREQMPLLGYERGVDDAGFGRIRSKGDRALFGGYTTQEMKDRLGVKDTCPLADFLPTLTIAAKNLATEMTNYNVEEKDLQGEHAITGEHVQNNLSVREMLGQRGIKPENLPPAEDIKKLERRVKSQEKKLATQSGKLPGKRTNRGNDNGQKTELA